MIYRIIYISIIRLKLWRTLVKIISWMDQDLNTANVHPIYRQERSDMVYLRCSAIPIGNGCPCYSVEANGQWLVGSFNGSYSAHIKEWGFRLSKILKNRWWSMVIFRRARCLFQGAIVDDSDMYNRTHEVFSM